MFGSEFHAFCHSLDSILLLTQDLVMMIAGEIETIFTDSKSLFDTFTKLRAPSENHMLSNLADCFPKENADVTLLCKLIKTRYLEHPIGQWIIELD